MRITLLGTGYWGKHYARLLTELADLRYIVDLNVDLLAEFQTLYPKSVCTSRLEDALGADVDAVCIVTPASTHARLATQALLAKKHVFVEKPLTVSPQDAESLVHLAAQNDRRLMTGFTFLFVPSVCRARERVSGQLQYMTSRRTNLGPIRSDVSVVWDLLPHDIAMFLAWAQTPVLSVSAVATSFVSPNPDAVQATLRFEGGLIATVFASWAEPRKVREVVLVGSDSMVVVDDLDAKAPLKVYRPGGGPPETPELPAAEPLKTELLHFLDCCADPSVVCISDGALGSKVTSILHAIDQSLAQAGHPVSLRET